MDYRNRRSPSDQCTASAASQPSTGAAFPAGRLPALGLLLFAVMTTMGGLFGGPFLGDHETLVALIARNMRLSGDWIVPFFLDEAFVRKPPLPYWLVASASYLLPPEPLSGLPVSTAAARLPSALAALATVLLLWRLGSDMFGRNAGRVAAIASSACICTLLYAPNATVEMLLTFCCTWAFAHFWYAVQSRTALARALHMAGFYVALGMGMLAKGPAPMALVAVPLAVWWFTYRPQRILARGGRRAVGRGVACLLRGLCTQTIGAFTRLWVIPGVLLFLAVFVPWMLAVARKDPSAWDLWEWQYLQRFQGDYADTKYRGPWYFIPIALGLVVPWTYWLFEGLVAPWVRRCRALRRPLFYVGLWGVIGVAVMSSMEFKKPYYIVPAVPGLLLLLTVPLCRTLQADPPPRWRVRIGMAVLAVGLLAVLVGAYAWASGEAPAQRGLVLAIAGALVVLVLLSAALYVRARPYPAFVLLAIAAAGTFFAGWYAVGPALDNVRRVAMLDRVLDDQGIPAKTPIYFTDQRPDARLPFYFSRRAAYLVRPSEVVTRIVDRTKEGQALRTLTLDRASELLVGREPVYLLLDREHLPVLKMLGDDIYSRVVRLASVDYYGTDDPHDWVIVTNRRP